MRFRFRYWLGLLSLVVGILLAAQNNLPAGSCGKWFVLGSSASRVRILVMDGQKLLMKKDWSGAAKKFEEAASHCEENAGYYSIGRASALAASAYEKLGDSDSALRFAKRAERLFARVPKTSRSYPISQALLKGVRAQIARLRPLHPTVQTNVVSAPPFTDPLIPTAYRRADAPPVRVAKIDPNEPGRLQIASSPGRAEVLLDGKRSGHTPLVLKGLKPGRHRVSVRRKAFRTEDRIIRLAPGAQMTLDFRLKRTARARLGKRRAHRKRVARPRPQPRKKQPKRTLAKRHVPRKTVPARPAPAPPVKKSDALAPSEERKFATLIVESRPSSLKVAVDGVKRGDSPVTVEAISPGRHTVKIGDGSGDYPSQSYEVNVRPGETYRLSAAMVLIRPRIPETVPPEGRTALDSDPGGPEESDRVPVRRVAFLATRSSRAGRPLSEIVPAAELPPFMRRESPNPLAVGLDPKAKKPLPGAQATAVVAKAPPPEIEEPPALNAGWLQLSMMGLGLVSLTGAFVGWRKRQRLLAPPPKEERIKIQIQDLETDNPPDEDAGPAVSEESPDVSREEDAPEAELEADGEEEAPEVEEVPDLGETGLGEPDELVDEEELLAGSAALKDFEDEGDNVGRDVAKEMAAAVAGMAEEEEAEEDAGEASGDSESGGGDEEWAESMLQDITKAVAEDD